MVVFLVLWLVVSWLWFCGFLVVVVVVVAAAVVIVVAAAIATHPASCSSLLLP